MARRVSLPSADDLFRATENQKETAKDGTATGGAGKPTRSRPPSTPYRTSPTRTTERRGRRDRSPAAGSSTTRR